jgi:hypothetical protein
MKQKGIILSVAFFGAVILLILFGGCSTHTRETTTAVVPYGDRGRGTSRSFLESEAEYILNPLSIPSEVNECDLGYGARAKVNRTERDDFGIITRIFSVDCKKVKWRRGQ